MGACTGPEPSSAAPLTVVCGTTLSSSPAGAVVYDATLELPVITSTTSGVDSSGLGPGFLRMEPGCDRGVTIAIRPAGAATIGRQANARDDLPVVLDVMTASDIHVTGTRDGTLVASAEIDLPAESN